MSLRLISVNTAYSGKSVAFFLSFLFLAFVSSAQSLDEVKKQANKLFEDNEFAKAYKLYAQLVSNYPKDPEYNYRLGVCMIYAEPDKKKCLPYLRQANMPNLKDKPKDALFYLGKAYHINYRFNDAIRNYKDFKMIASSSLQKKLKVELEIDACNNGKRLLSNLTDLVVISKKELNENDYFRSYDLKSIGGKLLVKPPDFMSSVDKKKKDRSVIYLPRGSNAVYYSSYGENNETGKDIYTRAKLPTGEFGPPQKLQGINTDYDDDYPFLHPDGKTLYFASKGYNSMGGYDIFKSVYDENTNTWSAPKNLEFPINSPDDDFLFISDSLDKTAYFSTGRQSPPGKIDVMKINTERKPMDVLSVNGSVEKEKDEQSVASTIKITNLATNKDVGIVTANESGDYDAELPNGAKLLFTVETPGLKTQTETVNMPMAENSTPVRQTITYEKGKLKITTGFDEAESDSSYLKNLKLIEEKAKLEVNEGQNQLSLGGDGIAAADSAKARRERIKPQLVEEEQHPVETSKTETPAANANLDNKQLAKLATEDANESKQEAMQLERDAKDALNTGQKQVDEWSAKITEAETTIKNAESITNEEEKTKAISAATEIKANAEKEKIAAQRIVNFGRALEQDAKNKNLEADLNKQYAGELEKSAISKNKQESVTKLETLQKQIADLNANKKTESDNVVNEIKNEIEQKETQLEKSEKINADIKNEIDGLKTDITNKQTELDGTRKKSRKEEIQTEINNLKNDQGEKEKQIIANDNEIKKLNEDLTSLKNQLDITNRIKAENLDATAIASATTATPVKETKTPLAKTEIKKDENKSAANTLIEKYKDKIAVTDAGNRQAIEQSNTELKNYNKEIDAQIAKDKTTLVKTQNVNAKQKINSEIKELEGIKKQNVDQIASNNKVIANIGINAAQTIDTKALYEPISAASGKDAVTKLDKLNSQLAYNDNDNFDYNSFQNPQAQSLKVEADARINDAVARQKKLKDEIEQSRSSLQNAPAPAVKKEDIDKLNTEGDDLHNKSLELSTQAKAKEGAERTKLIEEAKKIEDQANQKYVDAAEMNKSQNVQNYQLNKENIDALIKNGKSTETEIADAKKVNDEAEVLFKQSNSIREEAKNSPNKAVMLGNLSNAEEKEAEAILKQQQAVDILKKSNPDFALKTNDAQNANTAPDVNTQMEKINASLKELADIKLDSYQKLGEANNNEITDLSAQLKASDQNIESNPRLKSEYITSQNKLQAAEKLKQKADSSTNPGEKLGYMISYSKKQSEAIKEMNKLSKDLDQLTAKTTGTTTPENKKQEQVAIENKTEETKNPETKTSDAITQNTETAKQNTETVTQNENPAKNNLTETKNELAQNNITEKKEVTSESPVKTTPPKGKKKQEPVKSELVAKNESNNGNKIISQSSAYDNVKTDEVSKNMLSYFETKKPELKNPKAAEQLNSSLTKILEYNNEVKGLSAPSENGNTTEAPSVQSLKTKSEELLTESDNLNNEAMQVRKLMEGKTDEEKKELKAKADSLEKTAQDKNIASADLLLQSNELEVGANNQSIKELLEKVKTDKPDLSSEMENKNLEIETLHSQALQLRDEAQTLSNKAAKLGAYSNAEEKEMALIQKQNDLINELKKQYPDFVAKPYVAPRFTAAEQNRKKKEIQDKQNQEYTNVTNALNLEYETAKNSLPTKLSPAQQKAKLAADTKSEESKKLLISSWKANSEAEKVKSLALSTQLASEALNELNSLMAQPVAKVENPTKEIDEVGKKINESNNEKNKTEPTVAKVETPKEKEVVVKPNPVKEKPVVVNTSKATANPGNRNVVKIDGLEVKPGAAYSAAKPIPVNAKMEDGLTFRVQIGAFKIQLPNNTFKGLSPLNAETTQSGYFRYTAGNFNKYENANAVKNDLRGLGFSDAFVVAYFNGKRITIAEAIGLLAKEGKSIDANAPQSAGITLNANVPKGVINNNPTATVPAEVSKEIEKINGLFYTIQIGVFNKLATKNQLLNLRPVFTEQYNPGFYRYTAGIYNNLERLIADRNKVQQLGIRDAFVSAYLNSKRIPFSEAKDKQANDASIKMETENPIIFPEGNVTVNNQPTNNSPANNPAVQPFNNGVTNYPEATAQNGIKKGEDGVTYKVQVGAYSKQVPTDVAAKFNLIKTWPVENKQINNLFIYNIGNFTTASAARALLDEAKKLGLGDAFITVYRNGKKLYGEEASGLLK